MIKIDANIKEIKYQHFLCKELVEYDYVDLSKALSSGSSFLLNTEKNKKIAISRWVSPKRTRSYPFARVYNTLERTEKKVTIIPILKDEGKNGDRDFLQWDTISLMSLLDVYVIVSYYTDAKISDRNSGKITNQLFDISQIDEEIKNLLNYKSSPLHWNINQAEKLSVIGGKALQAYQDISKKLDVKMHSYDVACKKIDIIKSGLGKFKDYSRSLAREAQRRETLTIQPKEVLNGEKGEITIKNFLGGFYYLTVDEVEIRGNDLYLIEGKHSKHNSIPSEDDIKDGLTKMILYCNLDNVELDGNKYNPVPVLKLTIDGKFNQDILSNGKKVLLEKLIRESEANNFKLMFE